MTAASKLSSNEDAILTPDEAAEFLGFAKTSLANWRVRGGGPKFMRINSRSVRYRMRDLIEWCEQQVKETAKAEPR